MDTLTLINMAHNGDKASRDRILMENTGLIWSVVKRFLNRGYDAEELFQIGCIGMLKAIDRFDTNYNVTLSTYAVTLITGEIRRFLRDDGIIKISRAIKGNQMKIICESEKYRCHYQKEPSIEELEHLCSLTREEVVTALEASREVDSIDREIDNGTDNRYAVIDKIEDAVNIENIVLNRVMIRQILEALEDVEQKIIVLRYFRNQTQSDVAKAVGMSQVQVSRLEKKILNNLKNKLQN